MALTLCAGLALAACAHSRPWFAALPPASSMGAVDGYGTDSLAIEPGGEIVSFVLAQAAEIALVAINPEGRVSALYPHAPGESSRFTAGPHALVVPLSLEWSPDPDGRPTEGAATEAEAVRAYRQCLATRRPRNNTGRTSASRAPGDTSRQRETPQPAVDAYASIYSSDLEACGQPPAPRTSAAGQPGTFRPIEDVVLLVVSSTPITAERLRQRLSGLRVRSEADLRALPLRIGADPSVPWAGYYSRRLPSQHPWEMR